MFYNETNFLEKMKFKKKNISILTYLITFALWLVGYFMIKWVEKSDSSANVYYVFGMSYAAISFITALVIKNDRDKTLSFFKFGLLGYVLFTILFEGLIFAADAGGNTGNIKNILVSVCSFSRILIPLGMIIWQAKKWTFLTGINKSKKDTIDHLRNHGNDGGIS